MKKLMISLTVIFFSFTGIAQNATIDKKTGNYTQISGANVKQAAKPTGKTFTTAKGEVFPVYITDKQKLFIIRVSAKTQKSYRMYLKL